MLLLQIRKTEVELGTRPAYVGVRSHIMFEFC